MTSDTTYIPATGDRVVYARGNITHIIGAVGTVVAGEEKQTLPSGLRYVSFENVSVSDPAVVAVENLDRA